MNTEKLKIGQVIKTDTYNYTNELFKIIGFKPKRVKIIRVSTGNEYSWFIKPSRITEIVE